MTLEFLWRTELSTDPDVCLWVYACHHEQSASKFMDMCLCVSRVGLAPVSLTLPPDHSQASTRATTVGTLSQNEHAI